MSSEAKTYLLEGAAMAVPWALPLFMSLIGATELVVSGAMVATTMDVVLIAVFTSLNSTQP